MGVTTFFLTGHSVVLSQYFPYAAHDSPQRRRLVEQYILRFASLDARRSYTFAQIRYILREYGVRDFLPDRQQFRHVGVTGEAFDYAEFAVCGKLGRFLDISEIVRKGIEIGDLVLFEFVFGQQIAQERPHLGHCIGYGCSGGEYDVFVLFICQNIRCFQPHALRPLRRRRVYTFDILQVGGKTELLVGMCFIYQQSVDSQLFKGHRLVRAAVEQT